MMTHTGDLVEGLTTTRDGLQITANKTKLIHQLGILVPERGNMLKTISTRTQSGRIYRYQ
jgi:hypothetical protein